MLFVGIVMILWKGGFATSTQPLVIAILGRGLLATAALMGAAMIGLLIAGPLARIKLSKDEIEIEGDAS
jgi:hypothetical protein